MKKNYESPSIEVYGLEVRSAILTGSLTDKMIKVGSVTVEEYKAGFDEGGNDFKEISFD